ncbi:MAG: alpha/beta fold hydrolase [Ktedonobacteraceae bacterium]|nr:alpha/beta fold hydrolase [Ktedonobacteraceae bacterium]
MFLFLKSRVHPSARQIVVRVVGWLLLVCSILAGVLGAGAAFFGAAFVVTSILALVLLALCVAFLLTFAGVLIAARLLRRTRPGRIACLVGTATMLVLALVSSLTVFQPLPSTATTRASPAIPAGVRFWNLETGSRIAYLKVSAHGSTRVHPIIIVGGGPGEAVVAGVSQTHFFGQLARLGYDVYYYDQIGSGLSTRLPDPGQYTVARHVADLEAIRQAIGAQQMILLGSSWGGTLVANYMATYPRHVARAIFTSPGPIDYAEWPNPGSIISRLTPAQQQQANRMLYTPRFLTWYLLGLINARAAHSLISDQEADAFFDAFLQHVRPGTVCNPANLSDEPVLGNGFYANVFTTMDAHSRRGHVHPRARLRSNYTPALILTGACDYISWAATWQYKTTLPNSTLLYFPHAGHVIYLDQPDLYLATLRAFLQGMPLPLSPWTTAQPPPTRQEAAGA